MCFQRNVYIEIRNYLVLLGFDPIIALQIGVSIR